MDRAGTFTVGGIVESDQYADMIVGAYYWDDSGSQPHEGAAFVFHGSGSGITGSTIDNATLTVSAINAEGQTVDLHRITSDWGESSVTWNSFAGSYDPAVVGSYTAAFGPNTTDVTALVQAWVDGTVLDTIKRVKE